MLFTEQDLNYTNVFSLLENANYLSEDESLIHPNTIPVRAVDRIGYGVVRFDDVDRLAESHGIDYIDAMYAIAEASDINPEQLAVSVPEEELIAYPELVNELANIVVAPLSEDSFAYQYVDMCLEAWDNTGDEGYLGAIIDDTCLEEAAYMLSEADAEPHRFDTSTLYTPIEKVRGLWSDLKKQTAAKDTKVSLDRNKPGVTEFERDTWDRVKGVGRAINQNKAGAAIVAGTGAAAGYGVYRFAKWVKEANNRPKSWIGKKIAALRSIYAKWMQQVERNPQKAGMIQSACAKLLAIIDALMQKLQSAAG